MILPERPAQDGPQLRDRELSKLVVAIDYLVKSLQLLDSLQQLRKIYVFESTVVK